MSIYLTDDGTMDTVLCCDLCGEEFRGTFEPGPDHGPDVAFDRYDAYVEEFIAEVEAEHECEDDPKPDEEDIFCSDSAGPFTYQNRQIAENRAELSAWPPRNSWSPNVWFCSDHGNMHLLVM